MKPSLSTVRLLHRVNRIAPVACLASLLAAGYMLSHDSVGDRGQAVARARSIRASLGDVPFMAGDWVGTDCPLPAGATEILMPTAVLSRRFVELGTGRRATLGIIHCGDVRDMHGHHPPSCYPSSGWRPREGGHDTVELELDGERFTASLYRFNSTDSTGALREVSVVGFFVLPEGAITSDMGQLRSRAAKLDISRMGVGQIQVVVDGWPATAEVEEMARQLMSLIPVECIRALKGLPDPGSEARVGAPGAGIAAPGGARRSTIDAARHVKLHGVSASERIGGSMDESIDGRIDGRIDRRTGGSQ